MDRREFLKASALTLVAGPGPAPANALEAPTFRTGNARWQAGYEKALAALAANVQTLPNYEHPVLIEGAVYAGIWQECGPQESLVYRRFNPAAARAGHTVFFDKQRPDGQLPANHKRSETGYGQIQMVVPIAATAWEVARATRDDALLHQAYDACSRWDAWLSKYRNTRGTGLVEGFCTYDTGHDNSPRWKGIPNQCPGKDAKRFPAGYKLPRLCPDLSATVYGGRIALAQMASALGRTGEMQQWQDKADTLRQLILKRLYVPDDEVFYDLDADDLFVRIDCDILSRMCGEHVPEQDLFDTLWERQFSDPKKFWAPYPLPSVALDDPQFVRPIPRNSWGGASQALTALRAPRWMEHYGRSAEFAHLADRWCEAILREGDFRQQMDPVTGVFSHEDPGGYSPAALVLLDFTWRLCGIVETPDAVWWNVRPGHAAAQGARFRMKSDTAATLEMRYEGKSTRLLRNGREIARVTGGTARVVTDAEGNLHAIAGVDSRPQTVTVRTKHRTNTETVSANQRVSIVWATA